MWQYGILLMGIWTWVRYEFQLLIVGRLLLLSLSFSLIRESYLKEIGRLKHPTQFCEHIRSWQSTLTMDYYFHNLFFPSGEEDWKEWSYKLKHTPIFLSSECSSHFYSFSLRMSLIPGFSQILYVGQNFSHLPSWALCHVPKVQAGGD